MSNETIVRVTVDASGYEAGMARAKRSAEAFLATQEAASARTVVAQKAVDEAISNGSQASVRQINSFMQSLDKLANTYGKTKGELLTLQAAQLGVSATAQPMIEKVAAMEAAMKGAGGAAVAMAESEEQATARISEMVKASLSASAAMTDQTDVAARYAASVAEMAAAATAAERANLRMASSSEAVAKAQVAVATQVKVASTTVSDGAAKVTEALGRQLTALTATEAQMAVYDAQMAGMTEAEVAQIGAIAKEVELRKQQIALGEEMAAAYATEAAAAKGAHGATSAVTSEIMVMGREAANGNFTRLAGSFTRFLSLAGAMNLLLNPVSIALAAVGGSMLYVAEQNAKMNEALVLTGGYAGVTADQFRNMASAATADGATFSKAAESVTELAAKGRLTGDEIAKLGKTTANMATYASVSVKQMVDEFTKLADEPVKASVKLNDQYHYLTESTYDQIVALEKQGDATGAAQVAVEAFSKAMDERTKEIAANEGIILKGWRDIKEMINGAVEAVGSFGAAATPGQVVARMQANKAARLPIGQWDATDEKELQDAIATQQAAEKAAREKASRERDQQQRIDAKHAYDTWNQQFATPAEKRAREVQSYIDKIATPLGLSPEQQLADEQKINDRYKDRKAPQPKAYHDDAATRFVQQIRDQDAAVRASLSSTDKLTGAEKQLAEFVQKIADLKERHILTVDEKSLLNAQDRIKAQLAINIEHERELKLKEDIQKLDERAAQIRAQMGNYQRSQMEQHGRELDAFGMGKDAMAQVQAVKSIYAEYERLQWQLEKETPKSARGTADYLQAQADIKAGLQKSLQDFDEYYAALKAKQDDWTNGAATAFANYVDSAHNAAAQAQEAVTKTIKGMEDAMVEFVTTGRVSFTKLADGILADLTRMATRGLMSKAFENASSFGGQVAGGLFASHPDVAAKTANMLPGDPLESLMKLTKGFGTMGAQILPKDLGSMGAATQNTAALNAANATVATMTVGTLIGGFGAGGAGGVDGLSGLLGGLGQGDMAGAFGFTSTGVTGSVDAVAAGAMADSSTSGMTALFGLGGALAGGGPADGGTPYLVGEKGPELFVPKQSGRVVPNHELSADRPSGDAGNVSNSVINMNISVPPGTTRATAQQQGRAIMESAAIAQRRNG